MTVGFRPAREDEQPLVLRRCDICDKIQPEPLVRNPAEYYNRKERKLEPVTICNDCDYNFNRQLRQAAEKRTADIRSGTVAKVY